MASATEPLVRRGHERCRRVQVRDGRDELGTKRGVGANQHEFLSRERTGGGREGFRQHQLPKVVHQSRAFDVDDRQRRHAQLARQPSGRPRHAAGVGQERGPLVVQLGEHGAQVLR
jgi:hypothetical protein